MPDAQTTYELRLACKKPGCPVCALVQRAGARYIEGIFNESMLDPGIRSKLVESQGFCYEHTWQSIDLKLTEPLGHSILYQDLVRDVLKKITESSLLTGRKLTGLLEPQKECPACRVEAESQQRTIESLASALRNPGFVSDFRQSDGLCLPHLRRLLPELDSKRQAIILEYQRDRLESLKGELAELIRKCDYRFRDEEVGKEGDSYKRAADFMRGKRRVANKKDIY